MSTRKVRKETEGTLKSQVMDRLRKFRGVLALRLEDSVTSGIPDIVVAARRVTTWWEAKYGDPSFDWGGIQHLRMLQLEEFAYARYIVYRETADRRNQNVSIVRPSQMEEMENWETVGGFNHDWVVEYILREHQR